MNYVLSTEWKEWDGSEKMDMNCATAPVAVIFRNGASSRATVGHFRWDHRGSGGDIMAYCFNPQEETPK